MTCRSRPLEQLKRQRVQYLFLGEGNGTPMRALPWPRPSWRGWGARHQGKTEVEFLQVIEEAGALVCGFQQWKSSHSLRVAVGEVIDEEMTSKALGAMERQEEAQKKLDEGREPFAEIDERYSAELAKWEEQKPGVRDEAEALRAQIEVLRESLAPGRPLQR